MGGPEKEKSSVPLFDGSSFPDWKRRMGNDLIRKDYDLVVGFSVTTFKGSQNPVSLDALLDDHSVNPLLSSRQDIKARAHIENHLSQSVTKFIESSKAKSSRELWALLEAAYERSSSSATVTAVKQLAEHRLGSTTMQAYISNLHVIVQSLETASGQLLDDSIVAAFMLAGLPEEYNQVVTAIDSHVAGLKSEHVKMMLLNKEMELSSSTGSAAESAFLAKLKAEVAALRSEVSNGKRCDFCRKKGHVIEDCFSKHPSKRPSWYKPNKPSDEAPHYTNVAMQGDIALLDSGASVNMETARHRFQSLDTTSNHGSIHQAGKGASINIDGKGVARMRLGNIDYQVPDTLWVKGLRNGLISVGQATSIGLSFLFKDDTCKVFDENDKMILVINKINNLYPIIGRHVAHQSTVEHRRLLSEKQLLHERLGHPAKEAPSDQRLGPCIGCTQGKSRRAPFPGVWETQQEPLASFHTDLMGPFPTPSLGGSRFVQVFIQTTDRQGGKQRFPTVFFLKHKSEALANIKTLNSRHKNRTGRSIGHVHSDNEPVLMSKQIIQFYNQEGITHSSSSPYTPQENPFAERFNRTSLESAESMRLNAGAPLQFWAESLDAAVYLNEGRRHTALNVSPHEAKFHQPRSTIHLRRWGCRVYFPVRIGKKLSAKRLPGIFIGYSRVSRKGYRIWDPSSKRVVVHRYKDVIFDENLLPFCDGAMKIAAADSVNLTKIMFPVKAPSAGGPDSKSDPVEMMIDLETDDDDDECSDKNGKEGITIENDENPNGNDSANDNDDDDDDDEDDDDDDDDGDDDDDDDIPGHQTRHSVRTRAPINRFIPGANSSTYHSTHRSMAKNSQPELSLLKITDYDACRYPRPSLSGLRPLDIPIPKSLSEAMSGPHAGYWLDAVQSEIENLKQHGTWKLVKLPPGRKPIGSKWIFDVKGHSSGDGSIGKFKARLVAQGFSQREGVDYKEVFSPVANIEAIRLQLSIAAHYGWKLHHIDIVGAFLNGDMDTTVYMKQPPGMVNQGQEDLVCELLKSLYGLKQAGRTWNKKLDGFLTRIGFLRTSADPCIYLKRVGDRLIIAGIHVDDILLVYNDDELLQDLIKSLKAEWDITDLGEPTVLLGMRIRRDPVSGSISLDQEEYIRETLRMYNMANCKSSDLPHQVNLPLTKEMCPSTKEEVCEMSNIKALYGELIGRLLWISRNTRPDIAHSVGVLCRFIANPGLRHWNAAKLVLRYLSGTNTTGILYKRNLTEKKVFKVHAFSDADWAGDPDTRRSISANVFIAANGPIAWRSTLQRKPSQSSCESEYVSQAAAANTATWLRQLLKDLGFPVDKPMEIFGDNQGSISIAQNHRADPRSRHIEVKMHLQRHLVEEGHIKITYVPTSEMVADSLTKPINAPKFKWCRQAMGLIDLAKPTC
jgi:hypothetical protein